MEVQRTRPALYRAGFGLTRVDRSFVKFVTITHDKRLCDLWVTGRMILSSRYKNRKYDMYQHWHAWTDFV